MRNLKKVLTLVLCLAMMMSIMVVGAGAAFKDQSKIVNTEAVDACVALNIINGYTDGSYKPEGTITRAEACKMICVALNGGKEPVLGTNATASFTDIKGHWAEGYIEYCVSEGIVAGVGGGKFNPNGNVTGSQFAKMLLIALGYRADHEQFVGTAWEVNVNVKASQKDLYDELETMDPSVALTRDNAAQMVWNALQAIEVTYKYTLVTDANGNLTSKITVQDKDPYGQNNSPYTLLYDKYKAAVVDAGQLYQVTKDTNKGTYNLDTANYDCTKVADDYSDLIGQNVKILAKANDEVYGVYADEDSAVIAEGIVGKLATTSNAKEIKLDGTVYDLDQEAANTVCYLLKGGESSSKLTAQIGAGRDAWSIKLIDVDGDGDVNHAVITKVYVEKITYVNSTGIRVGSVAYDFDDHVIYDGAAKDDWAVIIDKDYTVDGKAVITKAETVSGKVESVNSSNDVRVGGVWYDHANSAPTTTIKSDVDLIVYGGMYFNCEGSSTDLDVAVVTGVGNYDSMNDVLPVKLMFQDGSEEIVSVEKWDTVVAAQLTNAIAKKDVLVSYDIDDDEYTLKTVANAAIASSEYTGVVGTGWSYDKSEAALVKGSTKYDIADDAMIVIKNADGDYIYMKGSELLGRNDIGFANTAYLAVDGNEVGALFAQTTSSITSGDKMYGYIVDTTVALNADNDQKLYIDVIVDGKKLENVETDEKNASNFGVGDVISYTMDGDVMCLTNESSDVNIEASIKEFNSARVLFYGNPVTTTDRVLLADDVVIIAIDSDDSDNVLYAGNSLMAANAKTFDSAGAVTAYYTNALYGVNSDGEIDIIFVEVAADEEF